MPKIFISYRRADSQDVTERIHDHMITYFGKENVFLDVDDIPPGIDFRIYLAQQIKQVDTVLVIIGPDWSHIMQERANHPNDFVRIEIENALQQDKFVIPILVKNAQVPDWGNLPKSIVDLGWRTVATIRRNPYHRADCERLAEWIVNYFENWEPKSPDIKISPLTKLITSPMLQQESEAIDSPHNLSLNEQQFLLKKLGKQLTDPDIYKDAMLLLKRLQARDDIFARIFNEIHDVLEKATLFPPFLPQPFEWIHIPDGMTPIAIDGLTDQYKNIEVSDFFISKYPITNAQLNVWTEHVYPSSKADHPALVSNWFIALSYCRWLGIVLGQSITLVSEAEWQRAAQGDTYRKFPWGHNFNKDWFNPNVRSIDGTTPVTYFPQGASPYGVYDLIGNGREWCRDTWSGEVHADEDNVPRVIKGDIEGIFARDYARASTTLVSDRPIGYAFRPVLYPHDNS